MHEKNSHRNTISIAHLEQIISHESLAKKEVERLDTPCSIHLHSLRHRLADTDGLSGKAVIDGIVKSGLLADDSSKEIKSVTFSQEKIPSSEEEKTIITITSEGE